jgi:hypothetical protein
MESQSSAGAVSNKTQSQLVQETVEELNRNGVGTAALSV